MNGGTLNFLALFISSILKSLNFLGPVVEEEREIFRKFGSVLLALLEKAASVWCLQEGLPQFPKLPLRGSGAVISRVIGGSIGCL